MEKAVDESKAKSEQASDGESSKEGTTTKATVRKPIQIANLHRVQSENKSESEALISDTESVGDAEESKVEKIKDKAKEIAESGKDNDQTADSEVNEDEIKKAAEYKDKGNEFFKRKSQTFELSLTLPFCRT